MWIGGCERRGAADFCWRFEREHWLQRKLRPRRSHGAGSEQFWAGPAVRSKRPQPIANTRAIPTHSKRLHIWMKLTSTYQTQGGNSRTKCGTDGRQTLWVDLGPIGIGDVLLLFEIDLAHVLIFVWRMTTVIQVAP